MTEKSVDLHIHTAESDGFLTPEQLTAPLKDAGITAFAITDHDSVAALDEMNRRAGLFAIRLIPGVELSAEYNGSELHFLGYFIDYHNKRFLDYLFLFRRRRFQRIQEMIEKFAGLGIKLSMERVAALSCNGPVGLPHIADALIEKGIVGSRDEAFKKYLYNNGPVYVEKYRITAEEVIRLIHSIGGAALLAHPKISCPDAAILELVEIGLDGIETVHPRHSPEDVKHYTAFAERHNLLISGGSDFHGEPDSGEKLGEYVMNEAVVDHIEEYCMEKRSGWMVDDGEKPSGDGAVRDGNIQDNENDGGHDAAC